MKKSTWIIVILFLLSALQFNFAQSSPNQYKNYFPSISSMDGYQLGEEGIKEYKGRKLFDLINGGGEVYFEYGFDTVLTGRYTKGEAGITVQFYVMKDASAAHGIYCFHRHPDDTIQNFRGSIEMNVQPNGVSFRVGKFFIKIESFDEGDAVVAFIKKIANNMVEKISAAQSETSFSNIAVPLPQNGLKKKTIKFLTGNITSGSGDNFYQGNPLGFKSGKGAYFAKYSISVNGTTVNAAISAVKKSDFTKGRLLFLIGKKLFGSKDAALAKAFYVDGMNIMGFVHNNLRYFVYSGNELIYIFSMIKQDQMNLLIKYIKKNKTSFK